MDWGKIVSSFLLPLLLGIAFCLVGLVLPTFLESPPKWMVPTAFIISVLLVATAAFLAAFSSRKGKDKPSGGPGGNATVRGSGSHAYGGKGGSGSASKGGDAIVEGNNSLAKGGDAGPHD